MLFFIDVDFCRAGHHARVLSGISHCYPGVVLITLAALWRPSLFSKTAPAYYRAFVVPNTKAFKIIVLQSQREHLCHLPQNEALPKSGHERSWFSSLRMACTSVADNAEHIWMLLTRCNVETVTGGHLT